jgi:hypothetical protein
MITGLVGASDNFPSQKKSDKQKNEKWAIDCVKSACDNGLFTNEFNREYNEIRSNMDLYNGVLNIDDMMKRCDPFGLLGKDFPYAPEHYPIPNGKINLLVGEEVKRRFDWHVLSISPDAISEKQKSLKAQIEKMLSAGLDKADTEEGATKLAKEISRFIKYEFKDVREKRATHFLKHMVAKEDMNNKWSLGFLDGLVAGREIYSHDIIGGEPKCRKVNPSNVRILRKGSSADITDADIIVEWGYHSPGTIVDDYHDYLTDKQVAKIDSLMKSSDYTGENVANNREPDLMASNTFTLTEGSDGRLNSSAVGTFLPFIDNQGGILVQRVVWRSYRKIQKLKFYDPNTDTPMFTFVDEYAKIDTSKGEEIVATFWVTDWWEGHRIYDDIYVKMRPWPVRAYGMMNPTGSLCPYTGGDYTTEGEPTTSLMGRMKPYSYYYDYMMYKQWEMLSKYKGTIGYLDLAQLPEGWEIEDALYYADRMGWLPVDSFKESKKGSSQGTLSGNMNTNRSPMNFEIGNYLQQNAMILNFLKEEMSEVSGVSKQRQGSISSSELVGNTERAVQQSSHITEIYFMFHEKIKLQTLKTMLEVAKYAYRGKKLAVQYITDDHTQVLEDIDGDDFREIDFGIDIAYSPEYSKIYSQLQSLAQAGMQNDKINFSQIMDIMMDPSIASVRRKIETAEQEKFERDSTASQNQMNHEKEMQSSLLEAERTKEQFKADIEEVLETVRKNGKIDLELVKGEIQKQLKGLVSPEKLLDIQNQTTIHSNDLEFKTKENEKDRKHEMEENSKDRKVKTTSKSS